MKKQLSLLLAFVMILGLLPSIALAAGTEEETLGEVDIFSGGTELSYLSINGRARTLIYTYYNFEGAGGTREIPAYCVNPNTTGVPQTVAPGRVSSIWQRRRPVIPKPWASWQTATPPGVWAN